MSRPRSLALLSFIALTGCGMCSSPEPETPTEPPETPEATETPELPRLSMDRLRFNQVALRLDLPLFWEVDRDEDGQPDPDEIRALAFYPTEGAWVRDGAFTPAFREALDAIRESAAAEPPSDARVRLVWEELDHAAPTLVDTDLAPLPEAHRTFARHMLAAGALIDRIYATQVGMEALRASAGELDPASQSLFRRNWGPACRGTTTEGQEGCSALPGAPEARVDVYPVELQQGDDWCQRLEARDDASTLLAPFVVVRAGEGDALRAVPYSEAYAEPMRAIATELRAAADALASDPEETALVTYLPLPSIVHGDRGLKPRTV